MLHDAARERSEHVHSHRPSPAFPFRRTGRMRRADLPRHEPLKGLISTRWSGPVLQSRMVAHVGVSMPMRAGSMRDEFKLRHRQGRFRAQGARLGEEGANGSGQAAWQPNQIIQIRHRPRSLWMAARRVRLRKAFRERRTYMPDLRLKRIAFHFDGLIREWNRMSCPACVLQVRWASPRRPHGTCCPSSS